MKAQVAFVSLLLVFSGISSAFHVHDQNRALLYERDAHCYRALDSLGEIYEYHRNLFKELDVLDKWELAFNQWESSSLPTNDVRQGKVGISRRAGSRPSTPVFTDKGKHLQKLASHTPVQEGKTYAIKESCLDSAEGIHCRLVAGNVAKNTEGKLDWNTHFYDMVKNKNNPNVANARKHLWSLAIGGSKYNLIFMGLVRKNPLDERKYNIWKQTEEQLGS